MATDTASDFPLDLFGLTSFLPSQKELVESLLSGRDVIAVMPTGSGKSLCYQLPAIVMPDVAIASASRSTPRIMGIVV